MRILLLFIVLLVPILTNAACPPVKRSQAVLRAFRQAHPCPVTGLTTGACQGWVLDHRYPLCAGGTDTIDNLTWQELQASKDKDRLERELCRLKPRNCPSQGD
jgi:hypothetical protein